ncbi:MAG TPA: alpha/beta fold hydrolase [Blastocatellia bacterium]|nr:alpha/beta fold hydrolase [Blastocatellia bacterium]
MKIRRRPVVFCAAGLPLALLIIAWSAGSILSYPSRRHIGNLPPDMNGRSVQFPSASGATLSGWLIPGREGAGAVVLMHGVRDNRLSMLERARFLAREGFTVLLFDFQAHGESTGDRITFGHLESRDAQAAVEFLRENAPDERIGVIGASLGGASTLLASPPLEVSAMVLESVYPTIELAVADRLKAHLGSWSGVATPLLTTQFKPRMGVGPEALRPIDHVGKITAPKFFIAGAADRHTTIEESRQLFNAAAEPKLLWEVNGAGHVNLHRFARDEYERRVPGFLKQYLQK